ncbi:eIF5-mimic protein 2 [Pocillopora verrucosa]|uniref:basic leucine zipper and W2 domain-containing protein 1-like n=1 Tax=Pocillopora damicornis TaxID=46731 RepID=UPI000F552BE5|nr:basic leucine zipper and W2 domain-containing protein 1-like [Pocillopora damicornis]XP_058954810.1 eIF5-mimic protein 2-like [Pocillopora verrucosa]
MSQKQPKPTLSGQRIRTRKRDEKEKQDPLAFRDAIIQGLQDIGNNDLEQVYKFLDSSGSKLNYRLYGECLFDILFAGGVLAPGGSILEEGEKATWKTSVCIFDANDDDVKTYVQVINKVIARYRYLQKAFEDEIKKILLFLKGFSEDQRNKLAIAAGIILANGMASPTALSSLLNENLVKEGLALPFLTKVFQVWVKEKDFTSLSSALRKAELENKLLDFFPPNKQTQEMFDKHFNANGLDKLVAFQKAQQTLGTRRNFQQQLKEMLDNETPVKEMISTCKEEMKKYELTEDDVVFLVWKCLMRAVEWNKKEELVADQALRHLKVYAPLLASFTSQAKSEINLLVKVQEYCYDNMNFTKVFQKMVLLLYKTDVLSEDTIIKWYKGGYSQKGKTVFLEQMKKMVEWLQSAEEETESEEEEEDGA